MGSSNELDEPRDVRIGSEEVHREIAEIGRPTGVLPSAVMGQHAGAHALLPEVGLQLAHEQVHRRAVQSTQAIDLRAVPREGLDCYANGMDCAIEVLDTRRMRAETVRRREDEEPAIHDSVASPVPGVEATQGEDLGANLEARPF